MICNNVRVRVRTYGFKKKGDGEGGEVVPPLLLTAPKGVYLVCSVGGFAPLNRVVGSGV